MWVYLGFDQEVINSPTPRDGWNMMYILFTQLVRVTKRIWGAFGSQSTKENLSILWHDILTHLFNSQNFIFVLSREFNILQKVTSNPDLELFVGAFKPTKLLIDGTQMSEKWLINNKTPSLLWQIILLQRILLL